MFWRHIYDALTPYIKAGLVKTTYVGEPGRLYSHLDIYLTEKGKKYLVDEDKSSYYVKLSTVEFGEVSGIFEEPKMNMAKVEYTLIRKNLTPFGRITRINMESNQIMKEGDIVPRKDVFLKYNDGWRLKKSSNNEERFIFYP